MHQVRKISFGSNEHQSMRRFPLSIVASSSDVNRVELCMKCAATGRRYVVSDLDQGRSHAWARADRCLQPDTGRCPAWSRTGAGARDQGYQREEVLLSLRKRLESFAAENGKFAEVRRTLKAEVAALEARLGAKGEECAQLLDMCNNLMSDVEAMRAGGGGQAGASGAGVDP